MLLQENLIETKAKVMPTFKFKKPTNDYEKAVQAFLTGQVTKFGKYFALPNALVYRSILTDIYGNIKNGQNVIAMRLERPTGQLFIGNSSILPLIGRTSNWGRESFNRSISDVQTYLSQFITMVPFTVFNEAGLNITKIEILDKGLEETVTRNETKVIDGENVIEAVSVHFTGASLFKVEDKTFLFDIDRREIEHKIFNPFLVSLVSPVRTITEAYESLKPQSVIDAEKSGLKVRRQGEWFFIPVQGEFEAVKATRTRWDKKDFEPLTLRAGQNRPNEVSKYALLDDGSHVVTGKVSHSGREHADLILKGWYIAVPNTSIQSFTITGDVD